MMMLLASQTFAITEASSAAAISIGLIALVIFGIDGVLFFLLSRMGNVTFHVEGGGLKIDVPLYGRKIDKSALKLAEARVIKLADAGELTPVRRTNGVGLPGTKVGWFKLRNAQKGLLFLADGDSALAIPTTEGYTLLLQPEQPDQLLAALRG
jgi:hypothetical protein